MERPMERPNTWEALLFAALQDMGPLDDGFRAGDLNIWSQDPQVFDHVSASAHFEDTWLMFRPLVYVRCFKMKHRFWPRLGLPTQMKLEVSLES